MKDTDKVLETLSVEERRGITYILSEKSEESLTYDELTDQMVEENYIEPSGREEFRIAMTHSHLPPLFETGFIEYDDRSETIVYDPEEGLEQLLESTRELDRKK